MSYIKSFISEEFDNLPDDTDADYDMDQLVEAEAKRKANSELPDFIENMY